MIVKAALFSALVGGYLPSAQSFVPSTSAGRYSVPSLLMSEGSSSAPKNSQAMMNQGFFGAQDEVQVDSTTFDASLSHLAHLGDYGETADVDSLSSEERRKHNLNVGKALDTLQRQLPYMFAMTNLDFSIFANLITLNDEKRNKFVMQRTLYSAAVRSMCMASRFSSIYPSLNLKNIEYIESESVIQCLVDVVLPDSVRVDGQAVWEGIFYFGLDRRRFIEFAIIGGAGVLLLLVALVVCCCCPACFGACASSCCIVSSFPPFLFPPFLLSVFPPFRLSSRAPMNSARR